MTRSRHPLVLLGNMVDDAQPRADLLDRVVEHFGGKELVAWSNALLDLTAVYEDFLSVSAEWSRCPRGPEKAELRQKLLDSMADLLASSDRLRSLPPIETIGITLTPPTR